MKISLFSKDDTVDTRIELVPLIDVIFCILTFFILASLSLTRQQAINMGLPKAATGTAVTQADENLIVVSLDAAGQTFVQKKPVSRDELLAQVQEFVKRRPSGVIVFNPALAVSYNEVIQMLDLLRSVGGERVALPTQPANQPTLLNPQVPNFEAPNPGAGPGGFVPGGNPPIPQPTGTSAPPPPPSSLPADTQ